LLLILLLLLRLKSSLWCALASRPELDQYNNSERAYSEEALLLLRLLLHWGLLRLLEFFFALVVSAGHETIALDTVKLSLSDLAMNLMYKSETVLLTFSLE